jgi:hypothetical protein
LGAVTPVQAPVHALAIDQPLELVMLIEKGKSTVCRSSSGTKPVGSGRLVL